MQELNVKEIKQVNGGVDWASQSNPYPGGTVEVIIEDPITIPIVPTPTWPTM